MHWQPSASIDSLKARSASLRQIRAFFAAREVMEVETPAIGTSTATDPHLESLSLSCAPIGQAYLQTSPEYYMKRVLAAGSGDIYQMGKTYRANERGPRHNPEFTMLEWYRIGFSLEDLLDEVHALVEMVLGRAVAKQSLSFREVFQHYLAVDPFKLSDQKLADLARQYTGFQGEGLARDDALGLLLSHCIEPRLGEDCATYLHSYPASQASLAQLTRDTSGCLVAKRFELYLGGIEIANAYQELQDPVEQRARMQDDNAQRRALGFAEIPSDEHFLAALKAGMPACSGVALGVDRLLMIQQNASVIQDVIAFPVDRA